MKNLLLRRRSDAVITVGTGGDKMFWGRLAAYWVGTPVIASALHSTACPTMSNFSTDVSPASPMPSSGVAEPHGRYLAESGRLPAEQNSRHSNGVDTKIFNPHAPDVFLRASLDIDVDQPVVGLVAALRPEKDHLLFLETASKILQNRPETVF